MSDERKRAEVEIVDAHTHVISSDVEAYPFSPRPFSSPWYLESPDDVDGFLARMDESGVAQAVLVQAVGAYSYDNRYVVDAVRAHRDRFVGACCIDVEAPDAPAVLRRWIEEGGLHGVRLFALSTESSWLEEESTFPVWREADALAAHVIVTVLPGQMEALDRMLERFPAISVSLDHCGFPGMAEDEPRAVDRLLAMARRPNLHLKVTTNVLDGALARGRSMTGIVGELVSAYGSDRIMWGSDYCQTHDRTYADLVDLARSAFGQLDTPAQRNCLGGTTRRLWPALASG